jgi:hypothetical protein
MPFATKTVTTRVGIASGTAPDGTTLTFVAIIQSGDPIRALTINNTATVNVFFTLGQKSTETADFFTVPPSTEIDFDVWELSDEDIHWLWFASVSAATFGVIYKSGPPVKVGIRTSPQGPKAAITA